VTSVAGLHLEILKPPMIDSGSLRRGSPVWPRRDPSRRAERAMPRAQDVDWLMGCARTTSRNGPSVVMMMMWWRQGAVVPEARAGWNPSLCVPLDLR
jgi:hypothetical protein